MEPRGMRTARATRGKSGAVVAAAGRWEVPADPRERWPSRMLRNVRARAMTRVAPVNLGMAVRGSGEAKCKATGWADRKMIENLRAVRMFPGTQLTGKFRKTMARRANGKQRATPLR